MTLPLSYFFLMLCVCQTTPTQNGSVCSLLSGWATTTGRLPGHMDTLTRYRIESRNKVSQPFNC